MKNALIKDGKIVTVFDGRLGKLRIAGEKLTVSPPHVGWEGHGYQILGVIEHEAPNGYQCVGQPSYTLDGSDVIEAYDVEPIPPTPEMAPAEDPRVPVLAEALLTLEREHALLKAQVEAIVQAAEDVSKEPLPT